MTRFGIRAATLTLVFAVSAAIPFTPTLRSAAAAGTDDDKTIVAVVNAEPITRQFLAEQALLRHGEEMLDDMVNRHLIVQACQQKGIQVTGDEVRDEIIHIAKKFGLSTEAYLQLLSEERDISPEQYSQEIIWPMLSLRKLVAADVQVTEEEFDKAFNNQFGESVKCRMIMVSDRSAAEKLHERAKADPAQFGELAKKYSEDEQSASIRGLIPPIRRHSTDPELEEAIFRLEKNEISDLIPMDDMWVILQVAQKLKATPPNEQMMPMVRQQITDSIRDEKIRVTATKLFSKLQQDANVTKVLGDENLEKQYPGVAAIINGQKMTVAQVAERCLKRHGATVLDGEINRKLLMQALKKTRLQVSQQDISAEVARAAISYGYVDKAGEADVDGWLKSVIQDVDEKAIDLYVRDAVWPSVALKKLVEGSVDVTEEDSATRFRVQLWTARRGPGDRLGRPAVGPEGLGYGPCR
jgi:parvulin-like peptidyl-prolyl isomerase